MRERGWYWVRPHNSLTGPERWQPLEWMGEWWWSDKQGGAELTDSAMAVIDERRIVRPELPPAWYAEAVRLRAEGWRIYAIAKHVGRSQPRVSQVLAKLQRLEDPGGQPPA